MCCAAAAAKVARNSRSERLVNPRPPLASGGVFMLPKASRLTRADFSARPVGQRAFSYGTLKLIPGAARAAVVVSKKISSKAVERNALRRRVYAALRPLKAAGALRGGLIVYPNKKAATASFSELKAALSAALSR